MPWFITVITTDKYPARGDRIRCFGFYNSHNDALVAVLQNRGSMQECLYEYLVIEEIADGIHPEVIRSDWFKWSFKSKAWIGLKLCPKTLRGISNFAIG